MVLKPKSQAMSQEENSKLHVFYIMRETKIGPLYLPVFRRKVSNLVIVLFFSLSNLLSLERNRERWEKVRNHTPEGWAYHNPLSYISSGDLITCMHICPSSFSSGWGFKPCSHLCGIQLPSPPCHLAGPNTFYCFKKTSHQEVLLKILA